MFGIYQNVDLSQSKKWKTPRLETHSGLHPYKYSDFLKSQTIKQCVHTVSVNICRHVEGLVDKRKPRKFYDSNKTDVENVACWRPHTNPSFEH